MVGFYGEGMAYVHVAISTHFLSITHILFQILPASRVPAQGRRRRLHAAPAPLPLPPRHPRQPAQPLPAPPHPRQRRLRLVPGPRPRLQVLCLHRAVRRRQVPLLRHRPQLRRLRARGVGAAGRRAGAAVRQSGGRLSHGDRGGGGGRAAAARHGVPEQRGADPDQVSGVHPPADDLHPQGQAGGARGVDGGGAEAGVRESGEPTTPEEAEKAGEEGESRDSVMLFVVDMLERVP